MQFILLGGQGGPPCKSYCRDQFVNWGCGLCARYDQSFCNIWVSSHTYIKVRVMTNRFGCHHLRMGPVMPNCHQGGVGSSEMDTNFIRNKSRQTIEYKFIFLTIKKF